MKDETDPFDEQGSPGDHEIRIEGLGRVVLPKETSNLEFPPGTSQEEAFAAIRRNYKVIEDKPAQTKDNTSALFQGGTNRAAGQALRNVAGGAAATLTMPLDMGYAAANVAHGLFNKAVGRDYNAGLKPPPFSAGVQQGLTALGLPENDTPMERVIGAAESGMAGAGVQQQMFSSLARAGDQTAARMAEGPLQQVQAGAAGGAAGAAAGEMGAGPIGQLGAAMAGGAGASVNPVQSVRKAFAGDKTPEQLAATEDTFKTAGTRPDVAQLSESRGMRSLKRFFQRVPGSAGPVADFHEQQQAALGAKATEIADRLRHGTEGTPTEAGEAMMEGISGEGGWKDRFIQGERILHGEADKYVTNVGVTNFQNTLGELTATNPGAKALTGKFTSKDLSDFRDALKQDLAGIPGLPPGVVMSSGGALGKAQVPVSIDPVTGKATLYKGPLGPSNLAELPADALKLVRSRVGERLENPQLISDATKRQYKLLYGALSRDLEMGAIEADLKNGVGGITAQNLVNKWKSGTSISKEEIKYLKQVDQQSRANGLPPELGPAFDARERANAWSSQGHDLINKSLQYVMDAKTPEHAFAYLTQYDASTRLGASKVQRLFSALTPSQADITRSAVIDLMGKAKAGVAAADGEFSSQTFLTNWNKITPDGRKAMFWDQSGEYIKDMNAIADVAKNIRKGYRVAPAPGTAEASAQLTEGVLIAESVMSGKPALAMRLLGGSWIANKLSKNLFMNPTVVHWLAGAVSQPRAALPAALNALSQSVARSDAQTQQEVASYISAVKDNDRFLTKLEDNQGSNNRHIYLLRDTIAR